jgi:hypothetical protein
MNVSKVEQVIVRIELTPSEAIQLFKQLNWLVDDQDPGSYEISRRFLDALDNAAQLANE